MNVLEKNVVHSSLSAGAMGYATHRHPGAGEIPFDFQVVAGS